MRRSVLMRVVMTAILFGAAGSPIAAVDTVSGVLVDSACSMSLGLAAATSAAHAACATTCAQKGNRLAVVTAKGDVYMVTGAFTLENNAKLLPMLNRSIVVTGTIAIRVVDAVAPTPTPTATSTPTLTSTSTDLRRPTSNPDTVVVAAPKKGDVREGEVPAGTELTIEAVTVSLAKGAI
jgi:hypothetical protein